MSGVRPRLSAGLAIAGISISLAAGPAWSPIPGGRSMAVLPEAGLVRKVGFEVMEAARTGVGFSNHLSRASAQANRLLEDGSGVAAGDVDGDGLCDLYFCRLDGPNQLFRNLGGWRFEDITAAAGVGCDGQFSTGAAFADLDGDGDLDLLVNATGRGTRCFLNDGKGHFTESVHAGFATTTGARSIAIADVDGDGDLDVYVTHYRATTAKDAPVSVRLRQVDGRWQVPPEHRDRFAPELGANGNVGVLELGEPDALYLNDGHAVFTLASWTGGRFRDEEGRPLEEPPRDWGLTAMFRDLNGDGAPDLYVCNDFYTPDRIWMNRGDGTFQAIPRTALRKTSWASMAVDFADIDRDGFDDFFVAEMLSRHFERRQVQRSLSELDPMPRWGWGWRSGDLASRPQAMRNTLFRNRGDGLYSEIAQYAGVAASEWTWGVAFLDVDLDGYEDLLIANGHALDLADADSVAELNKVADPNDPRRRTRIHEVFSRLDVPKVAFRNRGDLTFEETGAAWGFNYAGAANGMVLADLDNDGDLDVVLNNFDAPAVLLRNVSTAPRVEVRLKGGARNTHGVGARIAVTGGPVRQSQEVIAGGRYLSCDDGWRTFAAGTATNSIGLEILWRSGARSLFSSLEANRIYEIEEPAVAAPVPTRSETARKALFEDVSGRVHHRHVDDPADDTPAQPLLPRPVIPSVGGISWIDLNGDGHPDLVIPGGRGGRLAVLLNDGKGGFQTVQPPGLGDGSEDGEGMAIGFSPEPDAQSLLVTTHRSAAGSPSNAVTRFNVWAGGIDPLTGVEGLGFTIGAIAVADVDGDGYLDLFVGGRALPGRYPEAAPSRLYRNEGGRLVEVEEVSRQWSRMGLVTSAVWSDLDNDGFPELVVACEWGPIRVWRRTADHWGEVTAALGLEAITGWWQGVTTVDLDGDGRLDIVATNWGRNTRYREFIAGGIQLHYGEYREGNGLDLMESVIDPERNLEVPLRDRRTLVRQMPQLFARFESYRAFAGAAVSDVLQGAVAKDRVVQARTLDSMVFLNRGNRFEPVPMPRDAQLAPAFGVAVGDFDGDGREDVFISQNFHGRDPETSRDDAGYGLLLRGRGDGGLVPLTSQESGIVIPGEQRGCAVADFDADGRADLVVVQRGGETRLLANRSGASGLRVRLQGAPGNLAGIGAKLRVAARGSAVLGPVREIHAGSGCASQDSPVEVLHAPGGVGTLSIQWPGGAVFSGEIPHDATEVLVGFGAGIQVVRRR